MLPAFANTPLFWSAVIGGVILFFVMRRVPVLRTPLNLALTAPLTGAILLALSQSERFDLYLGRAAAALVVRPQAAEIGEPAVGTIVARDLPVVVSPAFGGMNVLRMNFLSWLEGWRVEGRTLLLTPHNPQDVKA